MSDDVIVVVVGNRAVAVLLVRAILLAILLVGIIKEVTVETGQDNLIGSIEAGQEPAISMNHGCLLMIAGQL